MNNLLKSIILALFVLYGAIKTSAQYFNSASTLPSAPTTYDQVKIIDDVTTVATGYEIFSYSISISAHHVDIFICYVDSAGFDVFWRINDTIPIGVLPAGNYHCTLYSKQMQTSPDPQAPMIPCDQLPYKDTFDFTFTVSQLPAGISQLNNNYSFILSPNPATNKLFLNASLNNTDFTITDITGRICPATHTDREIDISSLPAGVYTIRLHSTEGIIVRRFVKE